MSYRLEFHPSVYRDMRTLPAHLRPRIEGAINALASAPRAPKSKELRDRPGRYRVRVDEWRVVYQIDDDVQVVTILAVRRKTGPETYESLPEFP